MKKVIIGLFIVIFLMTIACVPTYFTEKQDSNFTKLKEGDSFIVFELSDVDFEPPSTCTGPSSIYNSGSDAGTAWNEKIRETLNEKFPNEKWNFVNSENEDLLKERDFSLRRITGIAEELSVVEKISQMEKPEMVKEDLPTDEEMKIILNKYSEMYSSQYAIIFVEPALKGEIHTTTTYNMNTGGMSSSSSKTFTAEVEIQLWDCQSGKMLYNSGIWEKSSGFCLITPEEMVIDNSSNDLISRLTNLIDTFVQDQSNSSEEW